MKPRASRSLADTLFGIQFRSPSKDKKEKKEQKEKEKREKKEKKEKKAHSRKQSMDSVASASNKSDRSSIVDSIKRLSSSDSAPASAAASTIGSVPTSPSAKALGKQRLHEDVAQEAPTMAAAEVTKPVARMAVPETAENVATPPRSPVKAQNGLGLETSPEHFHTAHDLKALADSSIPVYPTELKNAATAQAGAPTSEARPEVQRSFSEQMRAMDGGSFALPELQAPQVHEPIAEHSEEADDVVADSLLPSPAREDVGDDAASAVPTSSEASVASTALTSPDSELARPMKTDHAVTTEVPTSGLAPAIPSALQLGEKKLPMPLLRLPRRS